MTNFRKYYSATFILSIAALWSAAAAPAPTQTIAPDSYHGKLKEEFKEIGPARFVGGITEEEALEHTQGGWGMEEFHRNGGIEKSMISAVTDVQGQPFKKSIKLTVKNKSDVYWNPQFRIKNKLAVNKGDSILLIFWAKGKKAPQVVDDGEGAVFQGYVRTSVKGKFPKNRVSNFYDRKMLTETWKRYYIKTGPLKLDFKAGQLAFVGMLGHKAQNVEIGGIGWMVFPKGANLDKMPKPDWNYEGRDPKSAWRQEARERIEKYRKGNLTIQVVDNEGKPVPDANVKVRMKKHAFIFGTAVRAGSASDKNQEKREKYREISSKYFNSITIENSLKWQMYEWLRKWDWRQVKETAQFYHDKGFNVRGHVLVWPSFHRTPKDIVEALKKDKNLLRKTVNEHIIEEVTMFKPWITDWDVTNETNVNRAYMDHLGPDAMVEWYKTAHQANPKAKLTINECTFGSQGMELGSFPEKLLSDKCYGWVDYLIQKGAPLDYLGDQAHGGRVGRNYGGKTGPEGLWAYYDYLYGRYGKQLQLTELDVKIGNSSDQDQIAYQADMLRDTIIIAFAHPAFVGVTQWGFWAGSHYGPSAALWTKDWKLKPNGKAYIDLVYKTWWTNADLKTDQNGACQVRGFLGDYDIILDNGQTKPCQLAKSGTNLKIKLDKK